MKKELRAREDKLAGYVRHGMKSHMLAMTTSPLRARICTFVTATSDNDGIWNTSTRQCLQQVGCRGSLQQTLRETGRDSETA